MANKNSKKASKWAVVLVDGTVHGVYADPGTAKGVARIFGGTVVAQ